MTSNKLNFSYGKSYGIIENLVATVIFNIPFIFFFVFKSPPLAYISYSFVITFLLTSSVSHLKLSDKK